MNNLVNDSIVNGNASEYITLTGKTIHQFVAESYDFPDEAIQNKISGTISVEFVVENTVLYSTQLFTKACVENAI